MHRKYNTAQYLQSVQLLKEAFPGCAITTDMIVAFPGETQEEYEQSLAFIQECGFAQMHIFPYSRRPGTPADKMPGQHGNAVKQARCAQAAQIADEMSLRYRQAMCGSTQQVLFEEADGDLYVGHTANYVKVYIQGDDLHNKLLPVRITQVFRDGVKGVL